MSTVVTPSCDLRELQQEAKQDYRAMVLDLAAGGNIEPAKVRETLRNADVEFPTLESDLVKMRTRRQAAADLRQAADLTPRIAEADAAEREARERYDTTRQELQERVGVVYREHRSTVGHLEGLRKQKTELERDARRYLGRTACPSVKNEADGLRRKIGGLRDWLNQDAVRSVRALPARRARLQEKMSKPTSRPVLDSFQKDLDELDARIAAEQAALARVVECEGEIVDLQKQILEIEARVLDPARMAWSD